MNERARADDCSKRGLCPGIVKLRILRLNVEIPLTCFAGVAGANACSEDSAEWNFFEMRWLSMLLLYVIFQETGRGILCMCYITLKTPSFQTSWFMYHGFISEGEWSENVNKHFQRHYPTLDESPCTYCFMMMPWSILCTSQNGQVIKEIRVQPSNAGLQRTCFCLNMCVPLFKMTYCFVGFWA